MEVFAEGFQPREVQFAIVEQNPTLLNITLFREETNYQRLEDPVQLLDDEGLEDILEDKLDSVVDKDSETDGEEEDDDKIFGFIPNPLAKIQKDIQSNVDSFLSNIPLIG